MSWDGRWILVAVAVIGTATAILAGCSFGEDPLREELQAALQRQEEHEAVLVRQMEQLTTAAGELVTSDAEARREMVEAHGDLQQQIEEQRAGIDRQRDQLEQERRAIAAARHREPIVAAAILQVGALVVAALPLVLCFVLVRAAKDEKADLIVSELVVRELTGPPLPSLSWGSRLPWLSESTSRLLGHDGGDAREGDTIRP